MVDIVIPLGRGSKSNDELRYSLRSIEKHLKNYRNIYIIGECPKFITGVVHIPLEDKSNKQKNIMLKVLAACKDEGVSDDFMFWNDDFFLLQDTDAVNYPYYYNDFLFLEIERRYPSNYVRPMVNTYNLFQDLTPFHFDIHCPIIYNKQHFELNVADEDWSIRDGYIIKSLYANSIPCSPKAMADCKIDDILSMAQIKMKVADRHIFSVGDKGMKGDMLKYLNEFYPNKSKYEV